MILEKIYTKNNLCDTENTRKYYEAILSKGSRDFKMNYSHVIQLFQNEKYQEAIQYLNRILDEKPSFPDALLKMACAKLWTGKFKEALSLPGTVANSKSSTL